MVGTRRQISCAIAAFVVMLSMMGVVYAGPTTSSVTARRSAVDLQSIRVVDHSKGNFADIDDKFRGMSMTCEVAEIADMFSPAWLEDEAGVSKDVKGAGVACPFKFSIDFLGFDFAKFQGTLAAGVACPANEPLLILARLDSNLFKGSLVIEPSQKITLVPLVAELEIGLESDEDGNVVLQVVLSVLGSDLELAKDVFLGFACH